MTFTMWAVIRWGMGNMGPDILGVGDTKEEARAASGCTHGHLVRCSETITKGDWSDADVVTVLGQNVLITDLDFPDPLDE